MSADRFSNTFYLFSPSSFPEHQIRRSDVDLMDLMSPLFPFFSHFKERLALRSMSLLLFISIFSSGRSNVLQFKRETHVCTANRT